MALLVCPDCNGKVSDYAAACPHCGCPIRYVKAYFEKQKGNRIEKTNMEVGEYNSIPIRPVDSLKSDGKRCASFPKSNWMHEERNQDNCFSAYGEDFEELWDDIEPEDIASMCAHWGDLPGGNTLHNCTKFMDNMSPKDSWSFDDLESNFFEAKTYEYEDF